MIRRDEILRRFEQWLDTALAEEQAPQGISSQLLDGDAAAEVPTDLYAMWSAITALTQEVKLQGRAFKQINETLARQTEWRQRKATLDALLEVRERLLRGLQAVKGRDELRPKFWDRIFRERWTQIRHSLDVVDAMGEGYQLSLHHIDDLLEDLQLRPIQCEGQPFDPQRMSAVDIEETTMAAEGTVVFVHRTGYELSGAVYRPAKVRVAKYPQGSSDQ